MNAVVVYDPGQQAQAEPEDNLSTLIDYYTTAEEASHKAREKAERDRDYVDNKQLTEAEINALRKRGQPPISFNVIRSRANFLSGLEKKQRRDPKAWPRNNPDDLGAAEAFTSGMRYVVDRADYSTGRSQCWKNIVIEGFGGLEWAAVTKRNGDVEFTCKRIPWDRLFCDPHSSEPDYSDAAYVGQVMWLDYDEALNRAVSAGADEDRARKILDTTLSSAPQMARTYDDKPKWTIWADGKRKRVRLVMIWCKHKGEWTYTEFTKGGKLLEAVAPYVDEDGESYCPWILESANVDRDNNRYGEVRHLIDPQDEINKRRSKALHQSVSRGVIASEGAVADVNKARRELAKPDFYIEVTPGAEKFEIVDGQQLVAGQAALLQDAMNYVAQAGANDALRGTGSTTTQSGRAIEAQQAGGLVEFGDLGDVLRRMDTRSFRTIANMIKQFWTAEKWIRVTDDEMAPQWAGLNVPKVDEETGQPMVNEYGEPELDNNVAELDVDIIVSDAPDSVTLEGENYQAFVDLMASNLPPPMLKLAIEMNPSLSAKRKKQMIDLLEQLAQPPEQPQDPMAEQMKALALAKGEAEVENTHADTANKKASAFKSVATGEASLRSSEPQYEEVYGEEAPMGEPQIGPGPEPHPAQTA
jgi:hypothetical protein